MAEPSKKLGRRTVLAGVGAAGALAAAAVALPGAQAPAAGAKSAAPDSPPDTSAGYRLTEHVKHYYRTARI
ncbi:MAG: formate dehydrogenase [Chitinophagaceae bacterium]|nr:formate dehydrogenase [Rubrivivax sp.]